MRRARLRLGAKASGLLSPLSRRRVLRSAALPPVSTHSGSDALTEGPRRPRPALRAARPPSSRRRPHGRTRRVSSSCASRALPQSSPRTSRPCATRPRPPRRHGLPLPPPTSPRPRDLRPRRLPQPCPTTSRRLLAPIRLSAAPILLGPAPSAVLVVPGRRRSRSRHARHPHRARLWVRLASDTGRSDGGHAAQGRRRGRAQSCWRGEQALCVLLSPSQRCGCDHERLLT